MSDKGEIRDTYAGALRHGLVDVATADLVLGVVRRPDPGFRTVVDDVEPAVAPPVSLSDEFETRREDLKMRGMCDEGAHNAAWEEVGFTQRYRTWLDDSPDAAEAIERLHRRLEDGDEIAFVSDERSGKKRSHRTILRERLESER